MNMCSTENIPTPIIQEFNLAPIPSPTTIPGMEVEQKEIGVCGQNCMKLDVENTHMNISCSTKNTPTPTIKEFNTASVPSPSTIPDSEVTHMNTSSSTENIQAPIMEEFNPPPVPSPTTIPGSSRKEKDVDSPPKMLQPCVPESLGPQHVPGHLPGSTNSEQETDNSSESSHPPHFPGNSACSSPQISAPPGWEHTSPLEGSSSVEKQKDLGSSPEISQPPGWENFEEQHIPAPLAGMGQMVCGGCRQLLSYPLGITRVKCPCCHTINFVLEEHQVGTVKCAKCWVWLMYPHGAPSVRCSACHFVTQIGEDNVRPPLSVQQNRPFVPPSPVQ